MSMTNKFYYTGFEGEQKVDFIWESSNEKRVFEIWNGYFETLLDCIPQEKSLENGILHEYYLREGWYEESPWKIKDVKNAIELFGLFDCNNLDEEMRDELGNMLSIISKLVKDIILFLEQALQSNGEVYIKYE